MTRFLFKLGGFVALQLGILCAIVWRDPGEPNAYQLTNVRHRMAAAAEGPRLIINGDSNTLTAFDCPLIHQATGLHPLNMGYGGGLHLDYILNETRDVARPGDSIILSLEYEHFEGADLFLQRYQTYTSMVARRPKNLCYVPWSDVPEVLDRLLPEYHLMAAESRRRIMGADPLPPAVEMVNEYGDLLPRPDDPQYELPDFSQVMQLSNTEDGLGQKVERLNRFVRECRENQVTVYLIYGPHEEHHFEHNREFIEQVHRVVESRFDGILLSCPADTAWPTSMFKDTHAHLNAGATRTHTMRFLELFAAQRMDNLHRSPVNSLAERSRPARENPH